MRTYAYICFFLLLPQYTTAQTNVFARAELDRNSVYNQQPFKVTFTVVTTTWYTAPLQFDNLQVSDAFIVPFTRSIPGQYEMNGKYLSGVQFYYMVFPYKAGRFSLPSMAITAESPAEGTSTGRKITVHTAPVSFTVKPVPKEYPSGHEWLVARDVSISDNWSKPLDKVKVGDVLERTITVDALGTLPQLIPEVNTAAGKWAGVYPKNAELKDTRDEENANGERTERASYLLLEAGTFNIPAVEVYWWNPYVGRLYKKSAPARTIHVQPNPDLGMLTTLKDSLAAAAPPATAAHKGPYRILGLPWYWALLYAAVILLVIWILVKMTIILYRRAKTAREHYLQSELHWFRQFRSADAGSPDLLRKLYHWWDRFLFPQKTITETVEERSAFHDYIKEVYSYDHIDKEKGETLKQVFTQYREQWKKSPPAEKSGPDVSADQRPWP
ncbi:BatD family protein [Chitinophaga barathri]|uniref:BatD family protein n=1 Tax=Chitinophaga barathri TaxID=1647451 RepID=UPI0013C42992|nr:BatD family protein [Chitinophaga barathri]